MTSSSNAICSISLEKERPFDPKEVSNVGKQISTFVLPFVGDVHIPMSRQTENIMQTTFECNYEAMSLIHNFVYETQAYDQTYGVVIDFNRL